MQTATLVTSILAALVFLAAPPDADAICCWGDLLGMCEDGTRAIPYCGIGSCNVFGCNCDQGCRGDGGGGARKGAGVSEMKSAQKLVKEGDLNGDGVLSVKELKGILQRKHY